MGVWADSFPEKKKRLCYFWTYFGGNVRSTEERVIAEDEINIFLSRKCGSEAVLDVILSVVSVNKKKH